MELNGQVINRLQTGRKVDDGEKRKLSVLLAVALERLDRLEGQVGRLEAAFQHFNTQDEPRKPGRPKKVA